MTETTNGQEPPEPDAGPVGESGGSPRFEIVRERPFQRARRIEREGAAARWNFFGALRASTRSETVTTVLLAANCAVFAAMVTTGVGVFEPSVEDLLSWGALRPVLTRDHAPWRLFTACFLHVGLIHLAVNMFSLWSMRFVESWFGHLSFAVLYLVSGLCGSLASTAFSNPFIVGAGASGALFGVLGAVLGAALRWKRLGVPSAVTGPILKGVLNTIVLNAVIAASIRNLDHFAHAGGFVSGILLGFALAHAPTQAGVAGRARRGWTVALASTVVVASLILALRVPGLAAAAERVETVRVDEDEMGAITALGRNGRQPATLRSDEEFREAARADWLPYLAEREADLRRIRTEFPILAKGPMGIDAHLARYAAMRARIERHAHMSPTPPSAR